MARKPRIRALRPAAKLGFHTDSATTVAIDQFLLRWGQHGMKTRNGMESIPSDRRGDALVGSIAYWSNYVSTVEHLRYQNCRKIASRNVAKGVK